MMRKSLWFVMATVIITVMTLTGCGKTSDQEIESQQNNVEDTQNNDEDKDNNTQEQESGNENVETIIITDAKGEVEIPANPQRIVDLSGNSDILSILGYRVAGTANSDAYDYTKFPSYLEETLAGATILGYSMQDTMDVEAVMNVEPDLIIISNFQEKMYDQFKEIAPTVMIQLEDLNWKDDILTIAEIFDKVEIAEEWIAAYEKKAVAAGESVRASFGEETSYLSFLASGGQFYVFGGAGFGSVLYEDMGLQTPAGLPGQSDISLPVVTYEGLATIEADYIFVLATAEDLAELEGNTIWNYLPAVKNGNVVVLESSPYFNQGYSSIGRELLLDEIVEMLNETKE